MIELQLNGDDLNTLPNHKIMNTGEIAKVEKLGLFSCSVKNYLYIVK